MTNARFGKVSADKLNNIIAETEREISRLNQLKLNEPASKAKATSDESFQSDIPRIPDNLNEIKTQSSFNNSDLKQKLTSLKRLSAEIASINDRIASYKKSEERLAADKANLRQFTIETQSLFLTLRLNALTSLRDETTRDGKVMIDNFNQKFASLGLKLDKTASSEEYIIRTLPARGDEAIDRLIEEKSDRIPEQYLAEKQQHRRLNEESIKSDEILLARQKSQIDRDISQLPQLHEILSKQLEELQSLQEAAIKEAHDNQQRIATASEQEPQAAAEITIPSESTRSRAASTDEEVTEVKETPEVKTESPRQESSIETEAQSQTSSPVSLSPIHASASGFFSTESKSTDSFASSTSPRQETPRAAAEPLEVKNEEVQFSVEEFLNSISSKSNEEQLEDILKKFDELRKQMSEYITGLFKELLATREAVHKIIKKERTLLAGNKPIPRNINEEFNKFFSYFELSHNAAKSKHAPWIAKVFALRKKAISLDTAAQHKLAINKKYLAFESVLDQISPMTLDQTIIEVRSRQEEILSHSKANSLKAPALFIKEILDESNSKQDLSFWETTKAWSFSPAKLPNGVIVQKRILEIYNRIAALEKIENLEQIKRGLTEIQNTVREHLNKHQSERTSAVKKISSSHSGLLFERPPVKGIELFYAGLESLLSNPEQLSAQKSDQTNLGFLLTLGNRWIIKTEAKKSAPQITNRPQ